MSEQEADHAWQARVGVFRDFSLVGGDEPLPVIFALPEPPELPEG
jgi:hypothetical protein